VTGGVQGIVIIKPEPPFGLPIDIDQWLYCFTLAVLLVMSIPSWRCFRCSAARRCASASEISGKGPSPVS
jgi:branched-chain amino acid transport system permease protein